MKKYRIIGTILTIAFLFTFSTSVFAFSESDNQAYSVPSDYGTEYAKPGDGTTFGPKVNEMTPAQEQAAGIVKPDTNFGTRATYNVFAIVTGSNNHTVYSTATGNSSIGYVSPRERVYVLNNNTNSNRCYIQFINNGVSDFGYVATSALSIPSSGWSRPITTGTITVDYMENNHKGIDVEASRGTSVYAVANVQHKSRHMLGEVDGSQRLVNFGNYISCETNGVEVIYAHLSSFARGEVSSYPSYAVEYSGSMSTPVVATWTPSRGANIGGVGSTGWSTGNHLHFEVRSVSDYRDKYDPFQYIVFPTIGY